MCNSLLQYIYMLGEEHCKSYLNQKRYEGPVIDTGGGAKKWKNCQSETSQNRCKVLVPPPILKDGNLLHICFLPG